MISARITAKAAKTQVSTILAALLIAGVWVGSILLVPTSLWFEVRSVMIHDTSVGVTPLMTVDRVIRRPFRGEWSVSVLRKTKAGHYYLACSVNGWADYRPENALPDEPDLNLDWWTWPLRCPLEEGSYRVRTVWTVRPTYFPAKQIENTSNEFRVSSAL